MFNAVSGTAYRNRDARVGEDQRWEFGAVAKYGHESCYLVMVEFEYLGTAYPVTHVVADETWLQILVDDLTPGRILSITWLKPSENTLGWEAVEVRELFLQERSFGASQRRLVVRAEGDRLFDSNGKVVADTVCGFRMRERVRSLFVASDGEPLGAKNFPAARAVESW